MQPLWNEFVNKYSFAFFTIFLE